MSAPSSLPLAVLSNRGLVAIQGDDARGFLQRLVTNDMTQVSVTHAAYSSLLTPQGKILFDFFIVETAQGFLIDCQKERVNELIKRLMLYKLRAAIIVTDESAALGVYATWADGPQHLAMPHIAGAQKNAVMNDGIAYMDPRLAALGARLILAKDKALTALKTAGFELNDMTHYDAERIRHGLPAAGQDFKAEEDFPLECNFEELNAIDFKKGCYIGQEVTSRTKRRGIVRKRLVPVRVEGALPPPGTQILAGMQAIGEMRSGLGTYAIALLRLDKTSDAFASGIQLMAAQTRLIPLKPEWAAFDLDDWRSSDADHAPDGKFNHTS